MECQKISSKRSIFLEVELETKFRRDGYVVVPLLDAETVRKLTKLHDAQVPNVPADHFFSTSCSELVRQKVFNGILECVEAPLKKVVQGYRIRSNCFVAKRAKGAKGHLALHRDPAFVDTSMYTAVHVWCPLVDVDERNGCVKVVAGSHELTNHISTLPFNPTPWDSLQKVLERECLTSVPMAAGHALIYDGRLLHASGPNTSNQLRIATSSVLVPEELLPRIYVTDPTEANVLRILEITDEMFAQGSYLAACGSIPYPAGMNHIGSLEYKITPLQLEEIEWLRSSKTSTWRNTFAQLLRKVT